MQFTNWHGEAWRCIAVLDCANINTLSLCLLILYLCVFLQFSFCIPFGLLEGYAQCPQVQPVSLPDEASCSPPPPPSRRLALLSHLAFLRASLRSLRFLL